MTFDEFLRARLAVIDGDPALVAGVRGVADQHLGDCGEDHACLTCRVPHPCPTLRLLAQPFAAHPDFDPAWAAHPRLIEE